MVTRKYSFPLAILAGAGRQLYAAMTEADDAIPTTDRFDIEAIAPADHLANHCNAKITAFSTGQANQNAQTDQAGNHTEEQTADFQEIKQLIAGARHCARLAFMSQLSDTSLAKSDAADDHVGLARQRITASNAVYADAMRIQNDARLQYPANQPGNETAPARFLLDEFPPRERSKPSGGTQTPFTTPMPSSGIMALGA